MRTLFIILTLILGALPVFAQKAEQTPVQKPAETAAQKPAQTPAQKPAQTAAKKTVQTDAETGEELSALFLSSPYLKDAQYSVYAKYIGGDEIISINPTYRLAPASVLKLYTTAAALDMLGPDFTFETQIYYSGEIKGKKLNGDIYIKGAGDPTLGSARFSLTPALPDLVAGWVEKIKDAGITKITGNIYADNSLFSGVMLPWRTSYQNIGNYYAAPSDALSVRDNSYEIYFTPAEQSGIASEVLKTEPEMNNLVFSSYVKTDSSLRSESTYVNFVPGSPEVEIYGRIPAGKETVKVSAAMPSPAAFMADYFKNALEKNGVQVKGEALLIAPDTYEDKTLFFSHFSPPLQDIISYTNKRSFNLYADTLLRVISAYSGGSGSSGEGIKKIKEFLKGMEIDTSNFDVFDGSGITRDNIIDCKMTVEMLEKVLDKPYGEIFIHTLPVAGDPEDGSTMARRLRRTTAAYETYVKTGSLDRARSLAGYAKTHDGKKVVFCSIVNNYSGRMKNIDEVHDSFVVGLSSIGMKKKPSARTAVSKKKK